MSASFLLTSNFPSDGSGLIAAHALQRCPAIELVWLPPDDNTGHLAQATPAFAGLGLHNVRPYGDVGALWIGTTECRALYLSGGNPIAFRNRLANQRTRDRLGFGTAEPLPTLVIGASGGALQLTPNISLFRLLDEPLETVLRERPAYSGLGLVPFEVLPHFNLQASEFLAAVQRYSESAGVDVWCIPDGSAVALEADGTTVLIGRPRLLRHGAFVQ